MALLCSRCRDVLLSFLGWGFLTFIIGIMEWVVTHLFGWWLGVCFLVGDGKDPKKVHCPMLLNLTRNALPWDLDDQTTLFLLLSLLSGFHQLQPLPKFVLLGVLFKGGHGTNDTILPTFEAHGDSVSLVRVPLALGKWHMLNVFTG